MKKVSVDNFRADPMFPRIEHVVAEQLAKGNVVAPCSSAWGCCGPSISPIGIAVA
jgi:hypothetical protein